MNVAVFSTKPYDRRFLDRANERHSHQLTYLEARLTPATAGLAAGHQVVCTMM
jgi:D-lactate dehydrogenase